jgi:hypothetical protein
MTFSVSSEVNVWILYAPSVVTVPPVAYMNCWSALELEDGNADSLELELELELELKEFDSELEELELEEVDSEELLELYWY